MIELLWSGDVVLKRRDDVSPRGTIFASVFVSPTSSCKLPNVAEEHFLTSRQQLGALCCSTLNASENVLVALKQFIFGDGGGAIAENS